MTRRSAGREVRGVASAAVVMALLMGLGACGGEKAKPERPPLPVETIAAPVRDLELVYTEMATLVSPDAASLGAEVAGRIIALPFDEGDVVKVGDELVRLDAAVTASQAAEVGDRVRQSEVALAAAERDLERARTLAAGGVASRAEVDAAEDRVALARTALDALRSGLGTTRAVLSKHIVRSPRGGVVVRRPVDLGEMVAPGQLLVEVAPVETLRAECHVPERIAGRLAEGDSVVVEVGTETAIGGIVRIAPAVEASTRTVKVEVEIANETRRFRPGAFARVRFILDRRHAVIAVPVSAVRTEVSGEKFVLIVAPSDSGTTVRRVAVRTGLEAAGWVEIVEGLSSGDPLVTLGASLITPGTRVEPRPDRRPEYAPYAAGGTSGARTDPPAVPSPPANISPAETGASVRPFLPGLVPPIRHRLDADTARDAVRSEPLAPVHSPDPSPDAPSPRRRPNRAPEPVG